MSPSRLCTDATPSSPASRLNMQRLHAWLGAGAQQFNLQHLAQCASTNSVLLQRAAQDPRTPSLSVLSCDEQTAGRGRRGRSWQSSAQSLCFSVLWRHDAGLALDGLPLAVGLSVMRALSALGAEGLALKWPNDIYLLGAKLGGILIERVAGPHNGALVIGIGLNVGRDAALGARLDQASSCLADGGVDCSREQVLAGVLLALAPLLDEFAAQGFAGLREEWMGYNAFQDLPVSLHAEGDLATHGICRGVDAAGALLLETEAGLRSLHAGDLSLRPAREKA